jgi:CheY-like chemotaxis protein
LAVVHGIIQRHKGTITVDSEPGRGTLFQVLFPSIEAAQETKVDSMLEVLPAGYERILLVDDEEVLVDLGERMLSQLGYQVSTRTSSREALDLFSTHPEAFDLLITDYTMPQMTGIDLAREVLKIRPDIPIVLCTGYSDRVTEQKAKQTGIREFILKPLKWQNLAQVVRKHWGRKT